VDAFFAAKDEILSVKENEEPNANEFHF
jgi:hypothetical protein